MFNAYQTRSIRFLGLEKHEKWTIKVYSISSKNEYADQNLITAAKTNLPHWLDKASIHSLPNYQVATLIIHEGREAGFAIVSWWVDENMLQLFAYSSSTANPHQFQLISDKGIVSCVWEMAVLWFERNAWVEEVLKQAKNTRVLDNYLSRSLNEDV